MPLSARNSALLRAFIDDVWNEGRVDAVERYVAAQYTIHHDPGDRWHQQTLDLAGFRTRLVESRAPFPDQRFSLRDVIACEDRVALTWTWQATHRGDIPGFAATNQLVRMSGATVYHVDADKLTGHWQIADRLGVFMQLREQQQTA